MLRIPVLGFLPFGRCCVVIPGCDLQRLSALVLRTNNRLACVDRSELESVRRRSQDGPQPLLACAAAVSQALAHAGSSSVEWVHRKRWWT